MIEVEKEKLAKLKDHQEILIAELKKKTNSLNGQLEQERRNEGQLMQMIKVMAEIEAKLNKTWKVWDTATPYAGKFNIDAQKAELAIDDDCLYQVVSLPLPATGTHSADLSINYAGN